MPNIKTNHLENKIVGKDNFLNKLYIYELPKNVPDFVVILFKKEMGKTLDLLPDHCYENFFKFLKNKFDYLFSQCETTKDWKDTISEIKYIAELYKIKKHARKK